MLKHQLVGRLGLILGICVLGTACMGGEIGGAPGEARLGPYADGPGTSGEASALVCSGVKADVSAYDGWWSSEAVLPASGALRFEFNARPTAANLDGLVAVGAQDIDDFTKAAIAVRFAEDGLVDARDGASYGSDTAYPYNPGVWYSIGVSADIESETYDVEIGRCGEKRLSLIRNASFRDNANVRGWLSDWAVWSSRSAALEVSTPAWMASGACVPASCESLNQVCGQPGDGCGGLLNCGSCGDGEFCLSGVCVDETVSLPPCEPATCPSLSAECGLQDDGCGGTLNCGGCSTGEMCSSGICIAEPVTPPAPPGGGGQPERPSAGNTGPSDPAVLTRYTGPSTITQDGATYENFTYGGTITIDADNVTLRNFVIDNGGGPSYGIFVNSGTTGLLVEDGEFIGAGAAAISIFGGATVRRVHIHDTRQDAIKIQGTAGVVVESSFIERLGLDSDAHADCIQTDGGGASNVLVRWNNFWLPSPGTPNYEIGKANSNLQIKYRVSNYVIEENWLNGGGWTVYCADDSPAGVYVRNNMFGHDAKFGPASGNCAEWSGNTWSDTGGPI